MKIIRVTGASCGTNSCNTYRKNVEKWLQHIIECNNPQNFSSMVLVCVWSYLILCIYDLKYNLHASIHHASYSRQWGHTSMDSDTKHFF